MDPAPDDGVAELLQILRRVEDDKEKQGDARDRIKSLPQTSSDLESCGFRTTLYGRLEAHLGAMVDAVLCSDELKINAVDGVRPNAVDRAVTELTGSPRFVGVVDNARAAIEQAASSIAADNSRAAAAPGAAGGSLLRRNLDALSTSDTEGENRHVRKKAARRNDWVDIFDRGGGLGGGLGFSPRVDVEAALAQLEAGLGSPDGSPESSVEALGLLAEADPELFQFGNHWKPFLKLARQALGSADAVVHAQAMTLHWVMYEKSMGMCAADMCEGVLAHARGYFSKTVHVLSATPTRQRHMEASANNGNTSADIHLENSMIIGDSKLSCAAREARALHGMLVTIHETFQHLPERRVWSIVRSFFSLLGDAAASLDRVMRASLDHGQIGRDSFIDPGLQPATSEWGDSTSATFLLPAHFLAVAGQVDDWLPNWLRAVPTGRLLRAVNDAGLVGEMTRRCNLRGRIPFSHRRSSRPSRPEQAAATTGVTPDTHVSAPVEGCQPQVSLVWHRLTTSAGSSGTLSTVVSATPLGRALWHSAAELEKSLLLQSVSFLGILATHCRGALNPCPPPSDGESGSEDGLPGDENEDEGCETGAGFGLERGEEVLHALVQCVGFRETDRGRSPVRPVALRYVRKLAKATAGSTSTPFTPVTLDRLFSPLSGEPSNTDDQDGSSDGRAGERDGSGRMGSPLANPPPAFLRALADIAGVLLSSRGASAGFFVEGAEGPQASAALLGLVRCTAELAKRACRQGSLTSGKEEDRTGREGHGREAEGRFRSLGKEESEGLAVDFACALATVMCKPPKERAAGRKALWRFGVPHALADLVAHLSSPGTDEPTSIAADRKQANGQNGEHKGDGGAGRDRDFAKAKHRNDLRDRLLLSLVDWARDLTGVSCLRRIGLVGPCGVFLARELGRRHLNVSTRDDCADHRPLATAMRIALCPRGLDSILSSDGDVVYGVESGLARLGELISLPELLEYQAVGLPPPHALVTRKASSSCGRVAGEPVVEEVPLRSAGLELGGDVKDLRCLDFIGRMTLPGTSSFPLDTAASGAAQVRRWLRWALSRGGLSQGGCHSDADDVGARGGEEEDGGFVPQDVRVAALQLATNLAADLSTAVAIEAEWSLAESLTLQEADGETAGAFVEDRVDRVGNAVGMAVSEEISVPGKLCRGGGGGGCPQTGVAGIVLVPNIVEPAALSRARLAVMLTCLGGPNEERNNLLRKLRDAEASASRVMIASEHLVVSSQTTRGDHGKREREEFPGAGLPDEDWRDVAARCVPRVVALLSDPRSDGRKEAFKFLREAAARSSPLLASRPTQHPDKDVSMGSSPPVGDAERRNSSGEDNLDRSMQAVMTKLCFSYARSLGFADDGNREQFDSGLRRTLAGTAGLAASLASPSPAATIRSTIPPQADCDWFGAVAFMVSGGDSEEASELIQNLHSHTLKALFLLPLAGQRCAAQEAAREATDCAADPGSFPAKGTSLFLGVAESRAHRTTDACSKRVNILPTELAGKAVGMKLSRGDPPLLLLLGLVEDVLEEELPLLSAAFRNSGWAAAALAARWMRQCMLCVVDWPGVVAYLAVALLRGHDYQVYFVVALFRTAQPSVLEAASKGLDLTALLGNGEALESFDLSESLRFTEELEVRHRERCLAATQAYLAQ
ncbi:unnamed protein product [Scytosiphon promiscuus]